MPIAVIAVFAFRGGLYRFRNNGALLLWFIYWFSTYRFGCNHCTSG